ncbi:MAG TPA: potassium-transporting ATPase subunit KdpC [Opitutaceae bacterium]|jgi:K+-transporting ATPase ATPase C chain|nr:potassium-transporting ATPase subunit KdpC [Opitutaceae bacterium]
MIKLTLQSILQTLMWTVIAGILYPLVMTVFFQLVFPHQANGSLVERDGKVVGSTLLAQQFQGDKYFWPRPSASGYGTGPGGFTASGASNLGPTSAQLQKNVDANLAALRTAHKLPADAPVPADLVFASASGLDPHISPEGARFQIARVAAARGLGVDQVTALVEKFIEPPQWGFLGEPRVNVLLLNLALDQAQADTGKK